jgi:hypothetical protein
MLGWQTNDDIYLAAPRKITRKKIQSGQQVSRPRFESCTSRIQAKRITGMTIHLVYVTLFNGSQKCVRATNL